ncbi:MAG: DUF2155 domain-containing protein [Rickettsiales bacterium]
MQRIPYWLGVTMASVAVATFAPLPLFAQMDVMDRITPVEPDPNDDDILSTRSESREQPQKMVPAGNVGLISPSVPLPAPLSETKPAMNAAPAQPFGRYQGKSPFGHAEPTGPVVPSGPHTTVAVPVGDVDAVEASEPAPATPTPPDADPAKENPEEPTELTSPIFEAEGTNTTARKLVIRALNKVTAQSELITLKPSEGVKFGQLIIRAVACQISSPKSQTDYAGLLDISEEMPTGVQPKQLFKGWMYASSPSIAALEHPVYDVTMVECSTQVAAPKKDDKLAKDGKDAKKPAKKAKN